MKKFLYLIFAQLSVACFLPSQQLHAAADLSANPTSGMQLITKGRPVQCEGDSGTGTNPKILPPGSKVFEAKSLVNSQTKKTENILCSTGKCLGAKKGAKEIALPENFTKVSGKKLVGRLETRNGMRVCGGDKKVELTQVVDKKTKFSPDDFDKPQMQIPSASAKAHRDFDDFMKRNGDLPTGSLDTQPVPPYLFNKVCSPDYVKLHVPNVNCGSS